MSNKVEKVNLPIYRAKKINSDEYIVSATIREDYKNDSKEKINGEWEDNKRDFLDIWVDKEKKWTEIDETTLAIHFPSMLDSQGNKIFASLGKDGKGGDILESKWFNIDSGLTVKIEAVKWSKSGFCFTQDGYNIARYEYKKIIGIQK